MYITCPVVHAIGSPISNYIEYLKVSTHNRSIIVYIAPKLPLYIDQHPEQKVVHSQKKLDEDIQCEKYTQNPGFSAYTQHWVLHTSTVTKHAK